MYQYFKAKFIPVVFVLTKADKLTNNDRINQVKAIRTVFPDVNPEQFFLFSSVTKENLDIIWNVLEAKMAEKR
jgi:GTP-binding protein EngB required for normal cell division